MAASDQIGFKLQVEEGNSTQTVKSFKQQLKEAKEEVLEMSVRFGDLSPQAIAAAKNLGAMKDQLEDANELSGALTDEKRFRAFGGIVSSVAGGFTALTGVIGLTNGESKEFEKTMLKVQSAMALSQGLTQVADIGRQWGVAKSALSSFTVVQKVNTAATVAATAIQKLFTGSVESTSIGFKVLRGAIIATGIGALIAAIGYVVANFKDLKTTIYNLIPFLETVEKFIGKIVEAVTDFVGVTSDATRATDALRASIASQNEVYDKQVQLMQAAGATAKDVRAQKNAMYEDEIKKLQEIEKLTGLKDDDKKKLADLKFQSVLLKAEQAKEDKDAAEEAAKKAEEDRKKAVAEQKQKAKEVAAQKKKDAEEAQRKDEEAKQQVIDALKNKNAYELQLAKIHGEDTNALRQTQLDAEIDLLKKSGAKYAEEVTALEREKIIIAEQVKADAKAKQDEADEKQKEKDKEIKAQLQADADAAREESEAKELELLQRKYDAMKEAVKGNEELTTAIIAAEAEAQANVRKKWDDVALDQKKEQAKKLAGILGGLSAVVGKETAVGKGLAVAEATISTFLGASKALAGISTANPFGAALAIANAAMITASGLKSVKTIVSTQVPTVSGSTGASSAGFSTPTASPAVSTAPTLDGIQSTLVNQTKQLTEGKEPLKAYVVESEITQKQERQKAITQTANF